MIITKVKKRLDNKTYEVYIDDDYCFTVEDIDIVKYNIKVGTKISPADLKELINNSNKKQCFNKAIKYLTYKQRTSKELIDKLKQSGFDAETIEITINRMKELGYINDREYIKSYINYRLDNKPMGRIRIKYELIKKGLSEDLIDSIMSEENLNELENAIKLLKKKIGTSYDIMDKKDEIKLKMFLQRRGYTIDIINKAFNSVKSEMRC